MNNGKAAKHIVETIAKIIFLICAVVAIVAVLSITAYMFAKGTPALAKVGVTELHGSLPQIIQPMEFSILSVLPL